MVSKSHVHAARTSPIPGLVVIVLAVAAVIFGLAVVQKPPSQDDELRAELRRLQVVLAAAVDDRATLEQRLGESLRETEALAETIAELARTSAGTQATLSGAAATRGRARPGVAGSRAAPPLSDDGSEADACCERVRARRALRRGRAAGAA